MSDHYFQRSPSVQSNTQILWTFKATFLYSPACFSLRVKSKTFTVSGSPFQANATFEVILKKAVHYLKKKKLLCQKGITLLSLQRRDFLCKLSAAEARSEIAFERQVEVSNEKRSWDGIS